VLDSELDGFRTEAEQMIPFYLPLIIAVSAGALFVAFTEASIYSKAIVLILILLSVIIQHAIGSSYARATGLVMQSAVGVYVLIYLKVAK
jgi:hypothetical protein